MSVKPKSSTILEPFAQSTVDSGSSPIKHPALPDNLTLIYIGNISGVLLLYSLRTSQASPPQIAVVRRLALPDTGLFSLMLPLVHISKVIVLVDGYLYLIDSDLAEVETITRLFIEMAVVKLIMCI